jgi:hypothetical protein
MSRGQGKPQGKGFLVVELHKPKNQWIVKGGTLDIQHGNEVHITHNILLPISQMVA